MMIWLHDDDGSRDQLIYHWLGKSHVRLRHRHNAMLFTDKRTSNNRSYALYSWAPSRDTRQITHGWGKQEPGQAARHRGQQSGGIFFVNFDPIGKTELLFASLCMTAIPSHHTSSGREDRTSAANDLLSDQAKSVYRDDVQQPDWAADIWGIRPFLLISR